MQKKQRPIIGVITAGACFIEQRQILKGIVAQAQQYNMDTAVFSNIYNPNVTDQKIFAENQIYELAVSQDLDALIIISESFVNPELREKVKESLMRQLGLPIIVVGTLIEEFAVPGVRFINTSDEKDLEDITDHLIEEHGFTKIDILTGFDFLEASVLRVEGYRNSLENHDIKYDPKRVHYGDFWTSSGEKLAKKYISGELPFPEAVICTNDYMAYGMLDIFLANDIPVPEKVSVVGYEYIHERLYHSPTLTTYQRNREAIGMSAVQLIHSRLTAGINKRFDPPRGQLIPGTSCPCHYDKKQLNDELIDMRETRYYDTQNLFCQMEPQLTESHNLDDFIKIAGDYQYLVRYVDNIYLCLSENWCDNAPVSKSDIVTCRSIIPWKDMTVRTLSRCQFSRIFAREDDAAVYYFNPLFSNNTMFGYLILQYKRPDTYDNAYRSWIKSITNGLSFMRMKNDIRYLTECQNLSESYDSATGIFNSKGFENAISYASSQNPANKRFILIFMKTQIFSSEASFNTIGKDITIANEIADALKLLVKNKGDICGRLESNLYAFAAFGDYSDSFRKILLDKLKALVIHKTSYVGNFGMNSFICTGEVFDLSDFDYKSVYSLLIQNIRSDMDRLIEKRSLPNFAKFQKYRDSIYMDPLKDIDADSICKSFCFSMGHFRHLYKNYFDVSFHQDCITSRITLAKYLLCTTSLDINVVASKCGYDDQKYFMRLFQQSTSYTPSKYRELFYK